MFMGNRGNFCLGRTIGAFLLEWNGFSHWTPQTLPRLSSYILLMVNSNPAQTAGSSVKVLGDWTMESIKQ